MELVSSRAAPRHACCGIPRAAIALSVGRSNALVCRDHRESARVCTSACPASRLTSAPHSTPLAFTASITLSTRCSRFRWLALRVGESRHGDFLQVRRKTGRVNDVDGGTIHQMSAAHQRRPPEQTELDRNAPNMVLMVDERAIGGSTKNRKRTQERSGPNTMSHVTALVVQYILDVERSRPVFRLVRKRLSSLILKPLALNIQLSRVRIPAERVNPFCRGGHRS